MLLQNGTVAFESLCHISQTCEQVSDDTGCLKSHETFLYGWLNQTLLNSTSGAGKVKHLTGVDGDETNCSLRCISFTDEGCDSVALIWRSSDI